MLMPVNSSYDLRKIVEIGISSCCIYKTAIRFVFVGLGRMSMMVDFYVVRADDLNFWRGSLDSMSRNNADFENQALGNQTLVVAAMSFLTTGPIFNYSLARSSHTVLFWQ